MLCADGQRGKTQLNVGLVESTDHFELDELMFFDNRTCVDGV